jgi:hypothetical protein
VLEKRKKIWIDRFQTYLFLRIAGYFVCYQVMVWALFAVERRLTEMMQGASGAPTLPLSRLFQVVVLALLALAFILDAVRLAHRVVGPTYAFRRVVRAITAGEEVPLVALRRGDFLGEFKDEFNDMLLVLAERGAVRLKGTAQAAEPPGCVANTK